MSAIELLDRVKDFAGRKGGTGWSRSPTTKGGLDLPAGELAFQVRRLYDQLAQVFGRVPPALTIVVSWGVALAVVGATVFSTRSHMSTAEIVNAAKAISPPAMGIVETPVTSQEYRELAERLTLFNGSGSAITVKATPGGIEVMADNANAYAEWRSSLLDVMTSGKDARWRFARLCAGSGCSQAAYYASLSGYRAMVRAK